jgi:hypothetical protein
VVIPEREAFSRLLLHRNAIQDHIPDAYLTALQRLYQQLGAAQQAGPPAAAAGEPPRQQAPAPQQMG